MSTAATPSASTDQEPKSVDVQGLNIPQLSQIKQQIEQEIGIFQESLQALKMAQGKFVESGESVDRITPEMKGNTVLVPLTSSIYVPGTIVEPENVIVDVGTGYYVQKDIDGAKDYFKRKITYVTEQLEKIQALLIERNKQRETICMLMERRYLADAEASNPTSPS